MIFITYNGFGFYSSMYTVAGRMHGPFRIGTTIDSITMSDNTFGTPILVLYQIKQNTCNTFKIFKVHSIFSTTYLL